MAFEWQTLSTGTGQASGWPPHLEVVAVKDAHRWNLFSSTEPDQAHDFLRACLEMKIHSSASSGRFRSRASARRLDDIPFSRLEYSARTRLSDVATTDLIVSQVGTGRYEVLRGRDGYQVPHGGVVLLPPDHRLSVTMEELTLGIVQLPRRLVHEAAEAMTGAPATAVRFESPRPRSPRAQQQWLRAVTYANTVASSATCLNDSLPGRLLLDQTRQILATALLSAFPHTVVTGASAGATPGRTGRTEPATLRRAMDHIEQNAHRPVTPAEAADAARTSVRALQEAFRRYRGTTPSEFIRRVRLDRAHRDLEDADPRDVTVAQIAQRWGFAHPGRFATQYRAVYGRSPHRTLNP